MTTTTTTMMMMMVVVCVSAASLGGSRRDDVEAAGSEPPTENRENVSTSIVFFRPDSHEDVNRTQDASIRVTFYQDVNITLDNSTRDAPSNSSVNGTLISPFVFVFPLDELGTTEDLKVGDCPLSTCLTTNLGSSLQRGDEKAGSTASDPYGPGKK